MVPQYHQKLRKIFHPTIAILISNIFTSSALEKRKNKTRIILGILFVTVFFSFGIKTAEAAPIKILNNSGHAYGGIQTTIDQLLGTSYTSSQFIIDYTATTNSPCSLAGLGSAYAGVDPTVAISTSTNIFTQTFYCDSSSATTTPSFPYQIFSTSFTGYPGDSVATYNKFAPYDITDSYAFCSTPTLKTPPAFYTAPGGGQCTGGAGVEWTLPAFYVNGNSTSGITADNTGIMSWLRFEHPTWNWFDVKAAMRQSATNWPTGYSSANWGFGTTSTTTANILTDNQILLQPPEVATSTSGIYRQLNFTVYPFRQTRRVKDVLFEFPSTPGFQGNELTLAQIQALGGTKVTGSDYTDILATTTAPFFAPITNAYFVWFTADNSTDSSANFSRIDTYNNLGPLSQSDVSFNSTFDLASPSNNVSTTSSPTFTWNAASSYLGISKYQLFIDGSLNKDNISSTSATSTASLSDGAHTWYVKAFNGGGTATSSVSTRTVNIVSDYTSGYTFYVDNVLGSDNNPGTQVLPWATLTKAGNTAQAGDAVVIIKNANQPYRVTFTPANHGTSGLPITFRGVDVNNKPEIWGSDDVSGGWSVYGGGNPNTYQKTLATSPSIVATGPSIDNLTKRVNGSSKTSLNPGEWIWDSNVLYYRLASGEDISLLHIEASARSYGISGTGYETFKNIIVRYANTAGVDLGGTGSIAQGIEAYDSYSGIVLNFGTRTTISACVLAGNNQYGIDSQYSNASIYNSLAYGNGVSGVHFDILSFFSSTTLRNNISSGNTNLSFQFSSTPPFTGLNNSWDIDGDSYWDVYKGTNNQELVDSLFVSTTTRNFTLQSTSPNIDAGIDVGLTTDILGNPIYGTPDIGPYEYQPPYTTDIDKIPLTGSIRIYKDGRYRMTTATSTATTVKLTITPEGGFPTGDYSEFLNLTVNTWNTSGDYSKSWTESSPVTTTTAVHTIGNLEPNGFYAVNVDGVRYAQFRADGGGQGTFTYSGGYSTHTFSIAPDFSIGNGPIVGSSFSFPSPLPNETDQASQSSITPGVSSLLATSTTSMATSTPSTTTPPTSSSSVVIKEKIAELQDKLIVLLKELVEQLQIILQEKLKNIS